MATMGSAPVRGLADLARTPVDPTLPATVTSGTPGPSALRMDVRTTRTFDTPAFAGMTFHEVMAKSALNRVTGMHFPWSINPYRGCSHACTYCFARPTHRYLGLSPGADFERQIVVKVNVVEVLRHELRRPAWAREHTAMGTNTDPYQRAEGRYRLMPGIIRALGEARTPLSILTKGTLITRDIDVLREAARHASVSVALTVGMLDGDLWRASEPGTPSPAARLAAVRRLNEAGIPTGVMLAPIMPGLNDDPDALTALVDAAAEAGAVHISPIVLHRRGEVGALVRDWLVRARPDVLALHDRLYGRSGTVDRGYAREVGDHVARARAAAWRRLGRPRVPPGWRGSADDRRPPVAADPAVARRDPDPQRPDGHAQLRLL